MTDATFSGGAGKARGGSLTAADERTRKRNRAEARFKAYGIAAICTGLFFGIFSKALANVFYPKPKNKKILKNFKITYDIHQKQESLK